MDKSQDNFYTDRMVYMDLLEVYERFQKIEDNLLHSINFLRDHKFEFELKITHEKLYHLERYNYKVKEILTKLEKHFEDER